MIDRSLIEQALKAGVGEEWRVNRREFDPPNQIMLESDRGNLWINPDGFSWESYTDDWVVTDAMARVVSLVRSVLSGGWREAVALHGIVPTLTNMIAETTRRKWDVTLHVETDCILWNIAEIWNEEGTEPPWGAGSEDVEEAMGQALLLALKDQKTA